MSGAAMQEAILGVDQMVTRCLARSRTGAPDAPPPPADLAIVSIKVLAGMATLNETFKKDTVRFLIPTTEVQ